MTGIMPGAALAIDGGLPARSRPDTVRTPLTGAAAYGDEEIAAVTAVLRERKLWRYHGDRVTRFEREVEARLGGGRALAVNSGTSALYLALAALDASTGAEVIVPTYGFVSCATAVAAAGFIPRFAPVDQSLGIDVSALAQHSNAAAVLAVHTAGAACDLDGVLAFAERTGAVVVEDVAQ